MNNKVTRFFVVLIFLILVLSIGTFLYWPRLASVDQSSNSQSSVPKISQTNSAEVAPAVRILFSDYLKNNLESLVAEKGQVAKGLNVTTIVFENPGTALVSYRNSLNTYKALVNFTIEEVEEVRITNFKILGSE